MRGNVLLGIFTSLLAACAGNRPDNLGVRDGRLASCPRTPNCVSSQTSDEGYSIKPLQFIGNSHRAFVRLQQTLLLRRDVTVVEEKPGYLRVEFSTRMFVDDGEFLVDEKEQCIHVRSASRLGHSDLGKNRSRLEEIRRAFDKTDSIP